MKNTITIQNRLKMITLPFAAVLFSIPGVASAKTIKQLLESAQDFLSTTVMSLLITLAMLFFFAGLIKYFLYSENPEKRTEGAKYIMYGLVALTLIFALWGVITVLANTFGIQFGGTLKVPQLSV